MSERELRKLFLGEEKRKTRGKIPRHIKDQVWKVYIGAEKAEGKCYVCGRTIHITDFEVGHNKAVAKGGSDHLDNLRPICRGCNLAMGTMSIEAFKRKYFLKPTKKKVSKKGVKTKRRNKKRPETLIEKVRKDFFG
ncbi:MAG: HNH endonuclease [Candidatus Bathyarchaeia archaeon]